MMSLFSSFDLFFFNFSSLPIMFIPFLICLKFWIKSKFSHAFILLFSFMSSFFNSLTSLKFKIFDKLVFSLMISLILINIFSILPYFFSFTSQISLNLFWGLSFWVSLFLFSSAYNVKYLLIHFIPEGTPFSLIWFLFLVEFISNLIRPLTLVVRLTANILAGHLLMILLSKMVLMLGPFILLYFFLNLAEFFVSLIQSYIFVTMVSLYFSEIV